MNHKSSQPADDQRQLIKEQFSQLMDAQPKAKFQLVSFSWAAGNSVSFSVEPTKMESSKQ